MVNENLICVFPTSRFMKTGSSEPGGRQRPRGACCGWPSMRWQGLERGQRRGREVDGGEGQRDMWKITELVGDKRQGRIKDES